LNRKNILLVSHGQFEDYFLETISEDIAREYNVAVITEECHADLNDFYEPTRRQYNANKLIKFLEEQSDAKAFKTICLCRVDLFIPILTYIFGQAVYKGKTGIASLYRLKNEPYGMKSDDDLVLDRFRKVVIHELGHTFGLIHCHVPSCVMRSSTYVEDLDQKKIHLCNHCRNQMESLLE
jgi:archaemetzincin